MFISVYLPIQKEMIQLDVSLRLFDNEGYFNGKFKFISNVDGVSNSELTQSKIYSKIVSQLIGSILRNGRCRSFQIVQSI